MHVATTYTYVHFAVYKNNVVRFVNTKLCMYILKCSSYVHDDCGMKMYTKTIKIKYIDVIMYISIYGKIQGIFNL